MREDPSQGIEKYLDPNQKENGRKKGIFNHSFKSRALRRRECMHVDISVEFRLICSNALIQFLSLKLIDEKLKIQRGFLRVYPYRRATYFRPPNLFSATCAYQATG